MGKVSMEDRERMEAQMRLDEYRQAMRLVSALPGSTPRWTVQASVMGFVLATHRLKAAMEAGDAALRWELEFQRVAFPLPA